MTNTGSGSASAECGVRGASIRRWTAILVSLLLLECSVSVRAQSDRGTLTGAVADPTGAAVIDTSVTAVNSATGVSTATSTGSDGTYTIPLLPPGRYNVTAEHAGFKTYVHDGIVIEIGQTARV